MKIVRSLFALSLLVIGGISTEVLLMHQRSPAAAIDASPIARADVSPSPAEDASAPAPSDTSSRTSPDHRAGAFAIPTTPTGSCGGDTSGTYPNCTVAKVNGATVPAAGSLVTGNGPHVSGTSALSYSALNLAGGSGWVSNQLPVANGGTGDATLTAHGVCLGEGTSAVAVTSAGTAGQLLIGQGSSADPTFNTVSGDGTISSSGVLTDTKVNGTSFPAGGALTTGNGPYVSGSSAATYSALNLAGGSGWVTGQLPVGNVANGTAGQFFVTNAGASAPAWVTLSSDVTCTSTGVCTVGAVSGSSPIAISAALTKFGSNAAGSGVIGLPNNRTIYFRNAANSADITGLGVDNANEILLGDGFVVTFLMSAGSNQLRWDNAGNLKMLVGNSDPGVGGGAGVLSYKNSTAIPTAVPSAGYILSSDTVGVHVDTAGTSFNDYVIAPVQQGTANSQGEKSRLYSGVARTTTNSAVTVLTIPVATSTTGAMFDVSCIGRDVSAGTVGDNFAYNNTLAFKNVAGTVTAASTQGTARTAFDTSMATCTITASISSTNVLIQATGLSSVTIDWTCEVRALIN